MSRYKAYTRDDEPETGGKLVASFPKDRYRIQTDETHHRLFDLKASADDESEDDPRTLAARTEAWERSPASVEPTKSTGGHDSLRAIHDKALNDLAIVNNQALSQPVRQQAFNRAMNARKWREE